MAAKKPFPFMGKEAKDKKAMPAAFVKSGKKEAGKPAVMKKGKKGC